MGLSDERLQDYRSKLTCSFKEVENVFADCMGEAYARLSDQGREDYLSGASLICMIGRGFEPVLVYLEEMPEIADRLGEETLELVSQSVWKMSRTPNGKAIPAFLQVLPEAARRLGAADQLRHFIDLTFDMMERTTGSIHGFHQTMPSPGLPRLLDQVPYLLSQLPLEGLKTWIDYGVTHYNTHPERQAEYFGLESADARAVLQRERRGTLFADVERKMDLYMRGLWERREHFVPFSTAFDDLRQPVPYFDKLGMRVPDCFDDARGIKATDRYRAVLAHMAGHMEWTEAIFADNFSPFQRVAIEFFEDCRIDWLAMRRWPGLKRILRGLHPRPGEDDCKPDEESCIRHRLAMFSWAAMNPDDHGYANEHLIAAVARFHEILDAKGEDSTTQDMVDPAISFIARTRRQADLAANVYFTDTVVDYRDDNRHMWKFIEEGDEEEAFDDAEKKTAEADEQDKGLPPRHYPEWDYKSKTYRPDWVSLYEGLHPSGDPGFIDRLLDKHALLAKRLKAILDMLKPQQYVRVRYQEDGSELDLDVAIRSLIDYKAGATPDPRITMSHTTAGRDIAVMLLLDLSASLAETPAGASQTVLELSQEAVALLGWSIERLGDEFAIAGFSSNTRHEVRYQHIKGYTERWDETVKARLAAMEAGYSTRMGAAMRHAAHYLKNRKAEKKLLLVLTDGEPSDIDVNDDEHLTQDTRKAVQELKMDGIFTHCINLDAGADAYVSEIFGPHYSVIDRIDRLPEKLPEIFLSLTK